MELTEKPFYGHRFSLGQSPFSYSNPPVGVSEKTSIENTPEELTATALVLCIVMVAVLVVLPFVSTTSSDFSVAAGHPSLLRCDR